VPTGQLPGPPVIESINPVTGTEADFPVSIRGSLFVDTADPIAPEVYFGGRKMPVAYFDPQGKRIDVNFPVSGLPTGNLDVTVKKNVMIDNVKYTLTATKSKAFYFKNAPLTGPVTPCFIATAAYGTPFGQHLDTFRSFRDGVLLQTGPGTAFVDLYYSTSPSIAKVVAAHPWLAALVRAVLTPMAWAIEKPVVLLAPLAGLALSFFARRRRAGA
jgi:hypothetical protein